MNTVGIGGSRIVSLRPQHWLRRGLLFSSGSLLVPAPDQPCLLKGCAVLSNKPQLPTASFQVEGLASCIDVDFPQRGPSSLPLLPSKHKRKSGKVGGAKHACEVSRRAWKRGVRLRKAAVPDLPQAAASTSLVWRNRAGRQGSQILLRWSKQQCARTRRSHYIQLICQLIVLGSEPSRFVIRLASAIVRPTSCRAWQVTSQNLYIYIFLPLQRHQASTL